MANLKMNGKVSNILMQRAKNLLETPRGTCPCMRGFGISPDLIDKPMVQNKTLYLMDVSEQFALYIPEVSADTVHIKSDVNGKMQWEITISEAITDNMNSIEEEKRWEAYEDDTDTGRNDYYSSDFYV